MSRKVHWQQIPPGQLPADQRRGSFDEVNRGYTLEEAVIEAERCVQCADPACQEGCPNNNPIRDFIDLLAEGQITEAAALNWTQNALPACTGRVCAWEQQCEGACVMGHRGDPINIGALERFIADYALNHMESVQLRDATYQPRAQRVAVIGAGPAGLAVAHFLGRKGYPVTIFESWQIPGGVMAYGIPEFVLPQHIIGMEIRRLQRLGVEIRPNVTVGIDMTIDDLFQQGFASIFVGVGANAASALNVPGEDLPGVWSAKDFLMEVATAQIQEHCNEASRQGPALPVVGDRVAVIGAGNTAMDAARTAVRLGAKEVTILYRRAEQQSPSRPIEIEHAKHEGVQFRYLVNPTRFLAGKDGGLAAVELLEMRLGEADSSGRPKPVPIPGSEHRLPIDTAVVAVGYQPQPLISTSAGLHVDRWGCLTIDSHSGATGREGVFAGGDCVTGPKTVVHAIAAARRAAAAMEGYMQAKAGHVPKREMAAQGA